MGAWGTGPFENDEALDWIYELEEHDTIDPLAADIAATIEAQDYIEADLATQAIAAAHIVACLNGRPADELPQDAQAWLKNKPRPSPELLTVVSQALEQAVTNSELQELWEETDEHDQWVNQSNACKQWLTPQA